MTDQPDGLNPGKYQGEEPYAIELHPEYKDYTPIDWALRELGSALMTDGAMHKDRYVDRAARVLCNTPVHLTKKTWESGYVDIQVNLGPPSHEYKVWRNELLAEAQELNIDATLVTREEEDILGDKYDIPPDLSCY